MTEEQNNITEAEANNLESLENANVEVKPEVELVSENSSSPKSEEIDLSEVSKQEGLFRCTSLPLIRYDE